MVFIPPPHVMHARSDQGRKQATPHDTTVGMFIVSMIMLGIAVIVLIAGSFAHNPPPAVVPYAILGLAALFGLISFLSWKHEQALGDGDSQGNTSNGEQ